MSFRTALTALATLGVAGVVHNYDIDGVPEAPQRAQLPALFVLPVLAPETQDTGFMPERGRGFQAVAFSSGAQTVSIAVTHLLVVAPTGQSKGLRAHLPVLVDCVDAYFAALGADITLGGRLREPAQVRVEPGIFAFNGVEYYGCAFRHTWVMTL